MLKIRDDIDLKELEKFGFKKQPKPFSGYYLCIARGVQVIFVLSDGGNREISIEKWKDDDPRIHKNPNCKYRANYIAEEILFDLIQVGLVKKARRKITLKEFWESKQRMCIHCDTEEKANTLLKAFDRMGKFWSSNDSYLEESNWDDNKEDTVYYNNGTYGDINYAKRGRCIYEFEEVDLSKY